MTSTKVLPDAERARAEARRRLILAEVRESLSRTPRELSPKFFYDERGSRLFEEITQLPEYYLTRAEREILVARADEIVAVTSLQTLVELGAGSAAKTRILLDAIERRGGSGATYVPIDVSEDFLDETRTLLEAEYPRLRVETVVADMSETLDIPDGTAAPILFAFLGSTIGNFERAGAIALLRRVRACMGPRDRLLLGSDLRKSSEIIEAAYNDAAGVTAEFNRNVLRVLNAELDADFVPEAFVHRAFYDESEHRIEMHLDAVGDQTVHIPGTPPFTVRDGEGIRTELSHKYDRESIEALAAAARLRVATWYTDGDNRFALSLLEPVA